MSAQQTTLWRLADYENGFAFKPDDFGPTGTPVVRIRQLVDPAAEVDLTDRHGLSRNLLTNGDLIFSWSGSLAVRIWDRGPAWLNQHLFKVVPAPGVDKFWLRWVIDSSILVFEGMMHGSAMTHLNLDMLKQVKIEVPPLDEQRRIANFLEAEIARIDQLQALQGSVLRELAVRDTAVRARVVDELAALAGELPLRRYSRKIEQGASPPCLNYPREAGAWGVVKLSAVKNGQFFPNENKQLPEDVAPVRQYELRQGDLLVTRANTPDLVGDVAVVSGDADKLLLPDLIYRVTLDPQVQTEFVVQVLLSVRVRNLIQAAARGSSQSMVKLRGQDLQEWPIPRANERQQTDLVAEINDHLGASARLRVAIDRQLALLAERRQALITAAVTGQIDVTTARGVST